MTKTMTKTKQTTKTMYYFLVGDDCKPVEVVFNQKANKYESVDGLFYDQWELHNTPEACYMANIADCERRRDEIKKNLRDVDFTQEFFTRKVQDLYKNTYLLFPADNKKTVVTVNRDEVILEGKEKNLIVLDNVTYRQEISDNHIFCEVVKKK